MKRLQEKVDVGQLKWCCRPQCFYAILKIIILVALWELIVHSMDESEQQVVEVETTDTFLPAKTAVKAPSCGQVCSYEGSRYPGRSYPFILKSINCRHMISRMSLTIGRVIYPPPKNPPARMFQEFTQFGDCPVKTESYAVLFHPNETEPPLRFPEDKIEEFRTMDKTKRPVNEFKDDGLVSGVLGAYRPWINNKTGFVFSMRRPWVEAILLNNFARHVTSLVTRPTTIEHPKISVYMRNEFADMVLHGNEELFDFGVSYATIQHIGLGRYGEPLNPYGDLEVMAQAWCMMKPGGLFVLAVPTSSDGTSYIRWNAQRVYGKKRLQHLIANWNLLEERPGAAALTFLVLSKPIDPS